MAPFDEFFSYQKFVNISLNVLHFKIEGGVIIDIDTPFWLNFNKIKHLAHSIFSVMGEVLCLRWNYWEFIDIHGGFFGWFGRDLVLEGFECYVLLNFWKIQGKITLKDSEIDKISTLIIYLNHDKLKPSKTPKNIR